MIDYDERDRAQRDDRDWFDRNLDREYRLRRAWRCEFSGEKPAGLEVFAIVHQQDDGQGWDPQVFGAPVTFETNRTDAQIREIKNAIAVDYRAMLSAK